MVSNAVIAMVLKGMDFLADQQKCIDYAKRHDAPKEVIHALERMPEGLAWPTCGTRLVWSIMKAGCRGRYLNKRYSNPRITTISVG